MASCRYLPVPKKTSITEDQTEPIKPTAAYAITETFESGTKGAYTLDSVQLLSGKWTFSDGLIGNLTADAKNGAIRPATCRLSIHEP